MMKIKKFLKSLNEPIAFPGCYSFYYITKDGVALHHECAKKNKREIFYSITGGINDGWWVVARDINYEDKNLYCDHCGKRIEPEYDI